MQNKTLLLLRGLPGAGKTTLAKLLAPHASFAADDFFEGEDGSYQFDANKLGRAHSECHFKVERSMLLESPLIVVHNTNTTTKELKPYEQLASKYGYQVFHLVVENRHGNTSVHDVPIDTISKMRKRFEVKL